MTLKTAAYTNAYLRSYRCMHKCVPSARISDFMHNPRRDSPLARSTGLPIDQPLSGLHHRCIIAASSLLISLHHRCIIAAHIAASSLHHRCIIAASSLLISLHHIAASSLLISLS
jgi:hypothetical protein